MTSLLFSDKELCLTRNFIDEAYRLFGIDCTLYEVSSMNMYIDDRTLENGINYKILLQEYVDSRLLSNLKWATLDMDRQSIVALSPIVYNGEHFNLREFMVIKLCNGDMYQIREVNSTYLMKTHYAIKLISYKDEADRPREVKQMKTNYLRTLHEEYE